MKTVKELFKELKRTPKTKRITESDRNKMNMLVNPNNFNAIFEKE